MRSYEIKANIDSLVGHTLSGHMILKLDESELKLFNKLDEYEQLDYIDSYGEIVVDDFKITDYGELTDVEILVK